MSTSQEWQTTTPVEVQVVGDDTPGIAEYAESRLREMFSDTRFPILHARIRITHLGNPARERPVVAQANLDVDGRVIRAQLRAPTAQEAVDRVRDRLRRRLHDSFGRSVDAGREPHEEVDGHQVPEAAILPPEEREILRNKVALTTRRDLDEAAAYLEDMDYAFQLLTEPTTGQDSVLYRTDAGLRLAQIDPKPDALSTAKKATVTLSEHPAPRLSVAEAVQRMEVFTQPFLFFRNAENDRGAVLYLRYDGHYGVITPE